MPSIKKGILHLFNSPCFFVDILVTKYCKWLPDDLYLRTRYWLHRGQKLNLKSPRTFADKINWLKLYNRDPLYTTMVDKDAVKKYVTSIIGSQYVIPTIALWNNVDDIEWDRLPKQFVLKTTHGGGSCGVVICKDKASFNKEQAKDTLRKSLLSDISDDYREWPYRNVPRKILAEAFMQDGESQELSDYKIFCFNGEPRFCQVIRDRSTKETIDFYDTEWSHQPFVGLNPKCKNGAIPVSRPICWDEMLYVAKKLSNGIPFARIDLYVINGKVYFGEITFYPGSGFGRFAPAEWNAILGDMITLPSDRKC